MPRNIQTPGRIQNVDPPQGSIIYTIGVSESGIGGSIIHHTILYCTILGVLLFRVTPDCGWLQVWDLKLQPRKSGSRSLAIFPHHKCLEVMIYVYIYTHK